MYIKIDSTSDYDAKKIILSLQYWDGTKMVIVPVSKKNVETYLSHTNDSTFIHRVSSLHILSASRGLPNRSAGDRTTTVNNIIDGMTTIKEAETVTADTMRAMIESNRIAFYSDAGHGWLRVPFSLINYLGINDLITGFSYHDKQFAYLEEDCDFSTFMIAIGLPYHETNKELVQLFWRHCPQHNCDHSSIRNYPSYDCEKMKRIFSGASLQSLVALEKVN